MAEEQIAITEAMNVLEAEPSSGPVGVVPDFATPGPDIPALREQLAVLVSTGKAKENYPRLPRSWKKPPKNGFVAPWRIPRPKFDVPTPNAVHQTDLLFLPQDKLPRGRKVYKYALTVTDVASRYKEAEPITSKNSDEVAQAFQKIYKRSPLVWPKMLQVDPGREFMGAVTK